MRRVVVFPQPDGPNNVTKEFVDYVLPLIQGETELPKVNGLPRFAKLKKIIVRLLIAILVFIVLTLQLPVTSGSKKASTSYDNVLSSSITNMDARIVDIALLGSHDAFSDGIRYSSKPNVNEGGIMNNKIVNILGKGLVVKMSKAQMVGAMDQLNAGVRYFDVRLTKIDDVYYTCHGYLSNTLDTYLKEIVLFLDNHPGEYIIFDLQYFYVETGKTNKKDDFVDLVNYMKSIKSSNGNSLLDYINYDSQAQTIASLTYGGITANKTKAGVIMLGKVSDYELFYHRDDDADYSKENYDSIFSYWHSTNSTKVLQEGIDEEVEFLKKHDFSNVLRVNQAQRTGFIMDKTIVRSIFEWSIIDMAKDTNRKLIKDENKFKENLAYMPIYMVDYSTSNAGSFNELANKYISDYNKNL